MRLGRNLAAGIAHTVVTTLVALAVVPLYIDYLGVEAYGLIGFNATLQAVLQLLDLGLTPAISREIARGLASDEMPRARNLLHSMACIYWGVALLIGLAFFLAAPAIADGWLSASHLSTEAVAQAVLLMGLMIACRWPSTLYSGALAGAHRLTVSSALAAAYIVVANCGAVLVLAFWSPTIEAFFVWQAATALVYTLAIRQAAWRTVGSRFAASFDVQELREVGRFSVGMSAVALTGIILTQLDKVILSKLLTLAEFGYFMLATAIATALYGVINALFKAIYPRFSANVAKGENETFVLEYRTITNMLALIWFPATMLLILCAEPLLLLWIGDAEVAARTAPILALLTAGTALHGMMYLPFSLQLAYGMTRLPLTINLLLMVVQVPLIIVLAVNFGPLGGAAAWLALQVVYINVGTWFTHRRIMKGVGRAWLTQDVGVPLAATISCGAAGAAIMARAPDSIAWQLLIGGGVGLAAFVAAAALSPYKPSQMRAIFGT